MMNGLGRLVVCALLTACGDTRNPAASDAGLGDTKLCDANRPTCANDVLTTCDVYGVPISTVQCPLGCADGQPRCAVLRPSNGLAQYLDMVADPPDVYIIDGVFQVPYGASDGINDVWIPHFMVAAQPYGSAISVFIANKVHIVNATALGSSPFDLAFALLARGDVTISGSLTVKTGAYAQAGCNGGYGQVDDLAPPFQRNTSGGGGGAGATDGGRGGDVTDHLTGGAAGSAAGTESLVPLRGGCAGGGVDRISDMSPDVQPTAGGGAVQISSETSITIDGSIIANGADGDGFEINNAQIIRGGGGGGAILLEAPSVVLGADARLEVRGGSGGACPDPAICAPGGSGASLAAPATSGADAASSNMTGVAGGGGGGGWGRIRVNTVDATYSKSSTTIEDGVVTTGLLGTR